MKTLKTLLIVSLLALNLAGCAFPASAAVMDEATDQPALTEIDSTASSLQSQPPIQLQGAQGALTQVEADGLLFMVEEEKLARDVYTTLAETWNLPVFANIARSEQAHMNAVLTLIDRYHLVAPESLNSVGDFTHPDLQRLYDELTATGQESLTAALLVGATIEEIDILDLEEAIDQTTQPDIIGVYETLQKGSRNHLRAFVSSWERQTGDVYEAQIMSPEEVAAILSEGVESGSGAGPAGGNGQRGRGSRGGGGRGPAGNRQ